MKTKLFYKIFAFTFGMMLLITVLAHVLIFMIAPSENVLITSTTVTNEDVLAFSEVDMPQLITQTILKSFPLSFACCMVISLVFSFLFSKGITGPILSNNPQSEVFQTVLYDGNSYRNFGPYNTKAELYAALEQYTNDQTKSGNMTEVEANSILDKYR